MITSTRTQWRLFRTTYETGVASRCYYVDEFDTTSQPELAHNFDYLALALYTANRLSGGWQVERVQQFV